MMKANLKSLVKAHQGKIHPFLLAITLLAAGLLADRSWIWQVGLMILVGLFVATYFRYRTMD
jgi:hypothetical protein